MPPEKEHSFTMNKGSCHLFSDRILFMFGIAIDVKKRLHFPGKRSKVEMVVFTL